MAAERGQERQTPEVRIRFPRIFTPQTHDNGGQSRNVGLMFDKTNKEHMAFLKSLRADAVSVLEKQWTDETTRPRIPITGHDKSPIKDGDTACNQQGIPYCEKYSELKGHFFLSCSNYNVKEPLNIRAKDNTKLLDESAIYDGCTCLINLNVYARIRKDNPGISFGLNGIMKRGDTDRFERAGRNDKGMFEATHDGADDPSNYGSGADAFGDDAGKKEPDPFD